MKKILGILLTLLVAYSLSQDNGRHLLIRVNKRSASFLGESASESLDYYSVGVHFSPFSSCTHQMMIALYHSTTILVSQHCQGFTPYDCKNNECHLLPENRTSSSYPYFKAEGFLGRANVYLDYVFWNLETRTIFTTQCNEESKLVDYGLGASGIIGMGISYRSSRGNFRGLSPLFSIYLKDDLSGGELLFKEDLTKAISPEPVQTLKVNTNWQFDGFDVWTLSQNKTFVHRNYFFVMFDLNSEVIGFPLEIYQTTIMTALAKKANCQSTSLYQPVCEYSGRIEDLPEFQINTLQGKHLSIPPMLYVKNARLFPNNTGSITLNFRATGPNLSEPENFVRESYANYIILGEPFLSYYYTVFRGSDDSNKENTITFYRALHQVDQTEEDGVLWKIGSVLVIILFIIGIVVFTYKYGKKKREVTQSKIAKAEENENESQNASQRQPNVQEEGKIVSVSQANEQGKERNDIAIPETLLDKNQQNFQTSQQEETYADSFVKEIKDDFSNLTTETNSRETNLSQRPLLQFNGDSLSNTTLFQESRIDQKTKTSNREEGHPYSLFQEEDNIVIGRK